MPHLENRIIRILDHPFKTAKSNDKQVIFPRQHHGTCHGTAMARHMDALPWVFIALPLDRNTHSWHCHGPAMGLPWPCHGPVMAPSWRHCIVCFYIHCLQYRLRPWDWSSGVTLLKLSAHYCLRSILCERELLKYHIITSQNCRCTVHPYHVSMRLYGNAMPLPLPWMAAMTIPWDCRELR